MAECSVRDCPRDGLSYRGFCERYFAMWAEEWRELTRSGEPLDPEEDYFLATSLIGDAMCKHAPLVPDDEEPR